MLLGGQVVRLSMIAGGRFTIHRPADRGDDERADGKGGERNSQ
jgi:hypothetical protein